MIKEFVNAWNKNKDKLREYFETHEQIEYVDYGKLVNLILDLVVNPEIDYGEWINVRELDDGHYQGTLVFIFHRKTYQPSISDYAFTYVDYGSCSGCDTLQRIWSYHHGLPSEQQVKDYMTLCLHIIQRCKLMYEQDEYFKMD